MESAEYEIAVRVARCTTGGIKMSDWTHFGMYTSRKDAEADAAVLRGIYTHVRVFTHTRTTDYRDF